MLLLLSPLLPLSLLLLLPPSPLLLLLANGQAMLHEGSRSPFPHGVLRTARTACASLAPFHPPKLATARKAPSQAHPASTKSRTIGQQVLSRPKADGPRQGPAPAWT